MRAITESLKTQAIAEASDAQFAGVFRESAVGSPQLNAGAITQILATLTNVGTAGTINARSAQNVLGVNGGVLAADGSFTLQLGALDNVIVTPANMLEQHRLTLEVTFNRTGGGVGNLTHEHRFWVRNLADV